MVLCFWLGRGWLWFVKDSVWCWCGGRGRGFGFVNVDPFVVTSVLSVIWMREPSGIVASSIGSATEMCLPHFWASLTTKAESCSSSVNWTLLCRLPKRRW